MLNRKINSFLILGLWAILLVSCYEKQEGCLDINASNYDFSADEPCLDCCDFPSMRVSVKHLWGESTLNSNNWYSNRDGQHLKILSSKFYLSHIQLSKEGEFTTVIEEIEVVDENGNESVLPDNFAFVQTDRVSYIIGTFKHPDTYNGFSFYFGIPENIKPAQDTDGFIEDDTFFDEENFQHTNLRMQLVIDSIQLDTTILEFSGTEFTKAFEIQSLYEIPTGFDFTIPLNVDYQQLFYEIDLIMLRKEGEKMKVFNNLNDFFNQ